MEGLYINNRYWLKSEILEMTLTDQGNRIQYETFVFLKQWFDDDSFITVNTSGSTGKPKIIQVSKRKMLLSARLTLDYFGLKRGQSALLALSPRYIAGKMMIVRAIYGKLKLHLAVEEANPLNGIADNIDFAAMVPLQFLRILDQNPAQMNLVRLLLLGGSSLPASAEMRSKEIGTRVYHSYGMTETLSHIALRPVNGPLVSEWFSPLKEVSVSLDERNCLKILAPHISSEWLITNDVGIIREDGRFKVMGRIDEAIVFSGMKIFPQEVEKKLKFLKDVDFAVIGIEDQRVGQLPLLVINDNWNIKELFEAWKQMENVLLPNEMPRRIVCMDRLPYLESGKLNRRELAKMVLKRNQ